MLKTSRRKTFLSVTIPLGKSFGTLGLCFNTWQILYVASHLLTFSRFCIFSLGWGFLHPARKAIVADVRAGVFRF